MSTKKHPVSSKHHCTPLIGRVKIFKSTWSLLWHAVFPPSYQASFCSCTQIHTKSCGSLICVPLCCRRDQEDCRDSTGHEVWMVPQAPLALLDQRGLGISLSVNTKIKPVLYIISLGQTQWSSWSLTWVHRITPNPLPATFKKYVLPNLL